MSRIRTSLFVAVCLATAAAFAAEVNEKSPVPARGAATLPLNVCLVPEMGYIPEVNSWKHCSPSAHSEHTREAQKLWPAKAAELKPVVTPDLARRLSGWAKEQMKDYDRVPPLENVKLKPVAVSGDEDSGRLYHLVFCGTVDTLPSHSSVVTRWLQVYVLYSVPGKCIQRVTVTIRGQRLE